MTLETLAQTVHNMQAEIQQMAHAVQTINADNATTTATMNQLQAQQVQEAQAAMTSNDLIKKIGDALAWRSELRSTG